ncbi:MAG TPA: TIGR04372 family glycosyltransferase [Bosea sp. (in: a-proteobacteria)]|jgi:putative glycosyltransferase (TIGR04372 family)|uniref:TIGR04372 family glycosyltransferase n=1 Tax=Bosea sp. (in: a-proteobacteria) TaxID=1871050 RepID=UPI002DDCEB5F|nr:TIGR04372 family glycosyltransferase [Bosea sp. (in: a-proteobacteria)]HEV2552962.1 TIGR04372 family glycosyltransferase [Bosea sp. (in: a-proteobacteria)]
MARRKSLQCLAARAVLKLAHAFYGTAFGRNLARGVLRTPPGRIGSLWAVERLSTPLRRRSVEVIQDIAADARDRRIFIDAAKRFYLAQPKNRNRFDIYAAALVYSEFKEEALRAILSETAEIAIDESEDDLNVIGLRVSLQSQLGRYRDVVDSAKLGVLQAPATLRTRYDYLKAAYAAGKLRRERDAIEFFGRQFEIISDHAGAATDQEIARVHSVYQNQAALTLRRDVELMRLLGERDFSNCGVFFLSSTEALGHAILDPFYFIAQNKDRFDRLIFIGPPRVNYRPASRACLQIVEQYGDYYETTSETLLNLSWMSLGHHQAGRFTFIIDHYWMLLRHAVHRSRDPADSYQHNGWHLELPPYYAEVAENFAKRHGIDLDRPFVVMHVRDKGYHGIALQSYRDSAVGNYREAVEYLLDRGFQVIRIGDKSMPKLDLQRQGYFETPFLSGYAYEIDPYLIAKSRFMIGCQSGPCAFARALGVPILTVNAVLHYTLLPSPMEMACFKRYFAVVDGVSQELTIEQALDRGCYHFDNSFQYEEAGIRVENALPDEITAAVADMVSWLETPDLPETDDQLRFRERVEGVAQDLKARGPDLSLPIADYLGICLPGYRVSPSVSRMRAKTGADAVL